MVKQRHHTLTAPMVAAAVFLLVAVVHLGRILRSWSIVVNGWEFPLWLSWIAIFASALLALWLFRYTEVEV